MIGKIAAPNLYLVLTSVSETKVVRLTMVRRLFGPKSKPNKQGSKPNPEILISWIFSKDEIGSYPKYAITGMSMNLK